ncbi:MAG: FAD-dependent oxidoreductase, partial [Burkholderiaceae bacterium]
MSEVLSRRKVLKSALVGGVAMVAAPAMNLVPEAQAKQRAMPKKWDEEIDVLVIGSGFAGLAAAAEAAKAGAKTIILEKMPTYGGNSIINGAVYAAYDSELHLRQKLNYGEDSKEQHLKDTLAGGDFFSIPELAAVVASNSPAALNWMIDEGGCKLRGAVSRAGGHTAYRTHTAVEGVGRGFTEPLRKIAEKNGAKLMLEQEVTWIWRADTDAPVAGVEVKSGRRVRNIKVNKGLVLASGGFSRNLEMRKAHFPLLTDKFNSTNHKGATGEVLKFAQAVGADTLQM